MKLLLMERIPVIVELPGTKKKNFNFNGNQGKLIFNMIAELMALTIYVASLLSDGRVAVDIPFVDV